MRGEVEGYWSGELGVYVRLDSFTLSRGGKQIAVVLESGVTLWPTSPSIYSVMAIIIYFMNIYTD
jgi:hypothetical protein